MAPAAKPLPEDFQQLLERHAQEAIHALGMASAAITADAARRGALTDNRIVFLYMDALEEHWESFATAAMDELRRWSATTKIGRSELRSLAEAELRRLIPRFIEASRVERARGQFENQTMLAGVVERRDALTTNLDFRLRQFDIGMDDPEREVEQSWFKRGLAWVGNNIVVAIIVAVVAGLVLAALGLPG